MVSRMINEGDAVYAKGVVVEENIEQHQNHQRPRKGIGDTNHEVVPEERRTAIKGKCDGLIKLFYHVFLILQVFVLYLLESTHRYPPHLAFLKFHFTPLFHRLVE